MIAEYQTVEKAMAHLAIAVPHVDCHWKWRELAVLAGVKPSYNE